MKLSAFILLLSGVLLSSLVTSQAIPPGCTNITIPVTVSASVLLLPTTLSVGNLLGLVEQLLGGVLNTLVSGTFNIAATYCEPAYTNTTLENTLQVLVHG